MKTIVRVAILVALLAGGDVYARQWAQNQIADVTHRSIPDAGPTSAEIHSFPFLGRLLVSGTVPRIVVHQEDVHGGPVVFAVITVDLRGVGIDRQALLQKREVDLTRLDSGTVTAELTQEAVSQVVGVPVVFADGRASATVRGVSVTAAVAVQNGDLVLRPVGLAPLRLRIPKVPLLPCATSVDVLAGRVRVGCTLDHIPPELVREANRLIPRQGG